MLEEKSEYPFSNISGASPLNLTDDSIFIQYCDRVLIVSETGEKKYTTLDKVLEAAPKDDQLNRNSAKDGGNEKDQPPMEQEISKMGSKCPLRKKNSKNQQVELTPKIRSHRQSGRCQLKPCSSATSDDSTQTIPQTLTIAAHPVESFYPQNASKRDVTTQSPDQNYNGISAEKENIFYNFYQTKMDRAWNIGLLQLLGIATVFAVIVYVFSLVFGYKIKFDIFQYLVQTIKNLVFGIEKKKTKFELFKQFLCDLLE